MDGWVGGCGCWGAFFLTSFRLEKPLGRDAQRQCTHGAGCPMDARIAFMEALDRWGALGMVRYVLHSMSKLDLFLELILDAYLPTFWLNPIHFCRPHLTPSNK